MKCSICGDKVGIAAALGHKIGHEFVCQKCEMQAAREHRDHVAETRKLAAKVLVTTTPTIEGHRIRKYLGIESVEFVIGTGVFSEVSSSIADFFGARSSAFEVKLRQAKEHAMGALKFIAAEKGANAVVAIDLDYTEFTGNRIALIINGTLVQAEKIVRPAK